MDLLQRVQELFMILEGSGGIYAANENETYTICSNNGQWLQLDFTYWDVENGWDYLTIYNGNSTAGNVIGQYSGT